MRKFLLSTLIGLTLTSATHAQSADLLIQNARILDGTGNNWFWGSIDIQQGKIAHIYRTKTANTTAKKIIDAKGMLVTPGFIDVLYNLFFTTFYP